MEHHYSIFYKNDRLQFGWIKEVRKNKLVVVPEQGKEFNCAPSRVEYIWKGKIFDDEKEALAHLSEKSEWAIAEAEKIELEIIHELCDSETAYTLDELAENFLDNYEDGWARIALLIRLKNDEKLFQQKKQQFHARTAEEIQQIEDQEVKRKQAEERQAIEQSWAESLLANQQPSLEDHQSDHWDRFLNRLKNFAIHLDRFQEKEYFSKLFRCQMKDSAVVESILLDCLGNTVKAISWGKLIIERASVDVSFEEKELIEASQLVNLDLEQNPFNLPTTDHRDLDTYSVDNADTNDFDDALSWEETASGAIIRVFITDVASFIDRKSRLFDKASDRISSLYTLKETYPMFPASLSEGMFSLREAEDRAVLTFEFVVDQANEIVESKLYRSLINVNKNHSYDEIDLALKSEESFWSGLWSFCKRQSDIRRENGSLELERFEVKLDITDPEQIKIKSVRQNTPASLMIQELAILTNHKAASYAKDKCLPCLFRNQPPYTITRELDENEPLSLNDINIQPARVSLSAEGHSALGLDCYLQITSPIRRFLDLINQTMIMSSLGELENPFNSDELLDWARRGEDMQREYNLIERKLLDHWKIKYLEQNMDVVYDARLMRIYRNGKAQINLVDLQLPVETTLDDVAKDEVFKVKIEKSEPRYNRLVVKKLNDIELSPETTVESDETAS